MLDKDIMIDIQLKMKNSININNKINYDNIKKIAGIDLVYMNAKKNKTEYAICCMVLVDFESKEVIEKVSLVEEVNIPYIAGFLAFRELPLILKTLKKLKNDPDVYMFDGNGLLHSRNMGIATHAGIILNKPTIGVAKSYYKIDNVTFEMPENIDNTYTDIIIKNKVCGRAYRSHKDVKPIFISVGNNIDLEMSTQIVKELITKESRIPIPTRLADIETRKLKKQLISENL